MAGIMNIMILFMLCVCAAGSFLLSPSFALLCGMFFFCMRCMSHEDRNVVMPARIGRIAKPLDMLSYAPPISSLFDVMPETNTS